MLCSLRYGIATVFIIFPSLCNAAAESEFVAGKWLPNGEFQFSESGDLSDWRVANHSSEHSQVIVDQKNFLSLQFYVANRNISHEFIWNQLPVDAELIAKFIGTHSGLGIEIQRSYAHGEGIGTLIHEVQQTSIKQLPNEFQVQLRMLPNLRIHTTADSYLSNLFYGYKRSFVSTSADLNTSFVLVHESKQAFSVALGVRHFAVVMTPLTSNNPQLSIARDLGATLIIDNQHLLSPNRQSIGALELRGNLLTDTRYSNFLYSDVLAPLRGIAKLVEWSIQGLTSIVGNVGLAIIIFAFLFRVVMAPIALWSARQQRSFTITQQKMNTQIGQIEKTLKGAEKSEKILSIYKEHGISPLSGLKGSIGLLIQLPILIALFSVTTESSLFRDASFLWISDLSLPDQTWALTYAIPGFGSQINLLPVLLGVVSVLAALIQSQSGGSPRSGLILALIFVLFFYPCAAALVLYWLIVNCLQLIEGVYVSRTNAQHGGSNT